MRGAFTWAGSSAAKTKNADKRKEVTGVLEW
jgi:hypothetical protein